MDTTTLEKALEKKCKNHFWLAWILFLTATPTLFNSTHLASYVFLGGNPSFFCNIPELVEANWTKEQIRKISSPGLDKQSCDYYAWNYSLLKDIGFDETLRFFNETEKPDLLKCNRYIYEEDSFHQTIVSEWDLVCDSLPYRSTVQGAVAAGKFCGAVFFGLISDRFGRKKTFVFSAIIFMVAGPSAALVSSYAVFIVLRLLIGLSISGMYDAGYTLLMELTVKNYRACAGNIYNLVFPFGLMYLSLAAYLTNNWRQLQLAISVPMFLILIHCWFMPESPRWLIASGKHKKASYILGSVALPDLNDPDEDSRLNAKGRSHKNISFLFTGYFKLFSTLELAKRTLICYYLWFVGNFYSYVIAFNGSSLDINQYVYMAMSGVLEIPGYLLPILVLTYFGRKSSAIALLVIYATTMLVLIVLPQGWPIILVTFVGRLTGAAAYGVVMFQTLELFPTECRNTAMGSCLTMSQFGPLLAPYVVDILGKKAWWIPTTLCGLLALLGAFFCIFIPETRNAPLLDIISEMKQPKYESSLSRNERLLTNN